VRQEWRTARRALVAAAVAGSAVLAAGATSGAADTQRARGAAHAAPNAKPVASLRPRHSRVRVGEKLLFDASRSRDSDGRIVTYLWDFDGDGVVDRNTAGPRVRHAFGKAGKVRVAVVVVDNRGASATRRASVRAIAPVLGDSGKTGGSKARVRGATKGKTGQRRTRHARKASTTTSTSAKSTTLHAAATGSSSVAISDFKFSPTTITVSVGTTVTWTNQGPSGHTATADDGSFDTGVLTKGNTGSFRFTKAGTFSYHCTPHPQMKASVTVTAASGGSSASNPDTTSGDSSSKSSNLPHTGLQIASIVLAGLALLAGGAALRRRLARR
jgi:LPXTG-motif cell wall-anchored protein